MALCGQAMCSHQSCWRYIDDLNLGLLEDEPYPPLEGVQPSSDFYANLLSHSIRDGNHCNYESNYDENYENDENLPKLTVVDLLENELLTAGGITSPELAYIHHHLESTPTSDCGGETTSPTKSLGLHPPNTPKGFGLRPRISGEPIRFPKSEDIIKDRERSLKIKEYMIERIKKQDDFRPQPILMWRPNRLSEQRKIVQNCAPAEKSKKATPMDLVEQFQPPNTNGMVFHTPAPISTTKRFLRNQQFFEYNGPLGGPTGDNLIMDVRPPSELQAFKCGKIERMTTPVEIKQLRMLPSPVIRKCMAEAIERGIISNQDEFLIMSKLNTPNENTISEKNLAGRSTPLKYKMRPRNLGGTVYKLDESSTTKPVAKKAEKPEAPRVKTHSTQTEEHLLQLSKNKASYRRKHHNYGVQSAGHNYGGTQRNGSAASTHSGASSYGGWRNKGRLVGTTRGGGDDICNMRSWKNQKCQIDLAPLNQSQFPHQSEIIMPMGPVTNNYGNQIQRERIYQQMRIPQPNHIECTSMVPDVHHENVNRILGEENCGSYQSINQSGYVMSPNVIDMSRISTKFSNLTEKTRTYQRPHHLHFQPRIQIPPIALGPLSPLGANLSHSIPPPPPSPDYRNKNQQNYNYL